MSPARPSPDAQLAQLRELAEELRAIFASERHAVSHLEHEALERLAERKRAATLRLGELTASAGPLPRDLKQVFFNLQVEARANAMLAVAANEAIRSLLGQGPSDAYDRNARRTLAHQPVRIATTY